MKIKRLEIVGFKSFRDKCVLVFEEGVTGIVGPNGCGKSNVVDAIVWVLGEQSPKQLRSRQMEDVIFYGSQKASPLGMAEVTVVFQFDQSEQGEPVSPFVNGNEVAVTRRLFRSGESQYLINKKPCRLKDITTLFLGTGIGLNAYSIIEQGRIESLIQAKPQDRRILIEEIAGITKYKNFKEMTEKQIEKTRENLIRLKDIILEIETNRGHLAVQAEKAQQYRRIETELNHNKKALLASQWLHYRANLVYFAKLEQEQALTCCQEKERLAAVTKDRAQIQKQLLAQKEAFETFQRLFFERENQITLAQNKAAFLERELNRITLDQAKLSEEIQHLTATAEKSQSRIGPLSAEIEKKSSNIAVLKEELRQLEQTMVIFRENKELLERKSEDVRSLIESHHIELARRNSEKEGVNETLAQKEAVLFSLRSQLVKLQGEQLSLQTKDGGICQGMTEYLRQKQELEIALKELSVQIARDGERFGEIKDQLQEIRDHRLILASSLKERQKSLAQMLDVAFADELKHWIGQPALTLDEVVEFNEGYVQAVDAYLGSYGKSVIVDSIEAVQSILAGIDNRKEARKGPYYLIYNFVKPSSVSEQSSRENDRAGLANKSWYKGKNGYEAFLEKVLGEVAVVSSIEAGIRLIEAGKSRAALTPQGDFILDNGFVRINGPQGESGSGYFSWSREIKKLKAEEVSLKAAELQWSGELETLKKQMNLAAMSYENKKNRSHGLEIEILNLKKDREYIEKEMKRVSSRGEKLREEKGDMETLFNRQTEKIKHLERDMLSIGADVEYQGEALKSLKQELLELQSNYTDRTTRYSELKVQIAQLTEKKSSAGKERKQLQEVNLAMADTIANKEKELLQKGREKEECIGNLASEKKELKEFQEKRDISGQKVEALRKSLKTLEAEYQEKERIYKDLGESIDKIHIDLHRLEIKASEIAAHLEHLEAEALTLSEFGLGPIIGDYHRTLINDRSTQREIARLREALIALGEVNLLAIEEYQRLNERYQFLRAQETDLNQSLQSLNKSIDQTNETCEKLFIKVFQSVNENFKAIFPKLFSGGEGELTLTDPDHLFESGVEIKARPPGKKSQSLTLLSGGEKALISVSIILSLFFYQPGPFCLLDEVDAPLDDANIEKFNRIIHEMSGRSQFIIITHNKKTMEIAHKLFGVTMEEPGVSRLVSVRLGEYMN